MVLKKRISIELVLGFANVYFLSYNEIKIVLKNKAIKLNGVHGQITGLTNKPKLTHVNQICHHPNIVFRKDVILKIFLTSNHIFTNCLSFI